MFTSQPAELSLNFGKCRALAAVRADKVDSRFLVAGYHHRHGSSSSAAHYLYAMQHDQDLNELQIQAKLILQQSHREQQDHAGPVTVIQTSPSDPSIVVIACQQDSVATVWRIPERDALDTTTGDNDDVDHDDDDDALTSLDGVPSSKLESIASLSNDNTDDAIVDIKWRDCDNEDGVPSSQGDLVTVDAKGRILRWDVASGLDSPTMHVIENDATNHPMLFPPRVAWDPHSNGTAVAVTRGASVQLLDWRMDTSLPTGTVQEFQSHRYAVTDLDYNPNKPYVLATSGQDGLIKFWDLRSTAKHPLLVGRGGHSHWVWNVKYNPFHDQLLLSTGTDGMTNLWRMSTISSAPLLTLGDNDDQDNHSETAGGGGGGSGGRSETAAPNVRVSDYEHHDSVYAAAWSAADAWSYMTASYDGKVVLHHVPSKEKYKILL